MRNPRPTPNPQPLTPNPCVQAFGPDPAGHRCGACAHLDVVATERLRDVRIVPQALYFCRLSGAPKRVTWTACARFQAAPLLGARA